MRNLLLAAVAAWTLGSVYDAAACSCAPPPAPKEALERADAVFSGIVTSIVAGPTGRDVVVTLQAHRTWKGVETSRVKLVTNRSSAACGYGFRVGSEYLVYGYQVTERPGLSTNLCTRTRPVSQAGQDLEALGAGEPVPAP